MNSADGMGGRSTLTLTRRGRIVGCVLLVLLGTVLALVVPGVLDSAVAEAPSVPQRVEVVTISAGETLWGIAAGLTEPGHDVRDALGELMSLNGLESAQVQAGQQVLVPSA